MKAIVKNIEVFTVLEDEGWKDSFTSSMSNFVGKEVQVERDSNMKNWFHQIEDGSWTYHRTWLEFDE